MWRALSRPPATTFGSKGSKRCQQALVRSTLRAVPAKVPGTFLNHAWTTGQNLPKHFTLTRVTEQRQEAPGEPGPSCPVRGRCRRSLPLGLRWPAGRLPAPGGIKEARVLTDETTRPGKPLARHSAKKRYGTCTRSGQGPVTLLAKQGIHESDEKVPHQGGPVRWNRDRTALASPNGRIATSTAGREHWCGHLNCSGFASGWEAICRVRAWCTSLPKPRKLPLFRLLAFFRQDLGPNRRPAPARADRPTAAERRDRR